MPNDLDVQRILVEAELAANSVESDEDLPPTFVHGSVLDDLEPDVGYDRGAMYKLSDPGVLVKTLMGPIRWCVRYEKISDE